MKPIKLEYKAYEELKEELGNVYDKAMYEIGLSALKEIERLNNIINKAIEYIDNNKEYQCFINAPTGIMTRELKIKEILKGEDK